MSKNTMTCRKDGTGCYALRYECAYCGEMLTYVCPRDYYTDEWHNHFECCTHDCLERQFNYDKFKKQTTNNNDFNWRRWVEGMAVANYPEYLSPESIWNFHASISKSLYVFRELTQAGLKPSQAELLAWGDLSLSDDKSFYTGKTRRE